MSTPTPETPPNETPAAPGRPAAAPPNEAWTPATWGRFQEIAAKRKEAEDRAAALEARLNETIATNRALSDRATRAEMNEAMAATGLESLRDGEVRDFVRERYIAAQVGKEKPQPFGAWLEAQRAAPSPLLKPYLAAPAPPPPPAETPPPGTPQAPPPKPPGHNPNGGAAPPPPAAGKYTDAYVAQLKQAGQWSPQHAAALAAELAAEGLIIPPKTRV